MTRDEKKTGGLSEAASRDVLEEYSKLIEPVAIELKEWKTKISEQQLQELEDLENATWCRTHYDLLIKCKELLKRHPELIIEMRNIPIPSIPRNNTKKREEAEL